MKFNTGLTLTYGAAMFQAYHMGRAFHVYDPSGWHFANVNFGGLILGAILNVIVAQTAVRLPSISATFSSLKNLMPKASKKADTKEAQARSRALKRMTLAMKQNVYSQIGFYILLLFSALMVAPALFILWSRTLPFGWMFIGIMATVGAVAPDVAITVGGFAASDGERRSAMKPASLSEETSDGERRSASLKGRSARKPATVSEKPATLYRCVCGYTDANRYKYSGHTRTCGAFRANKSAQDAIPVELSAVVKRDGEG